MGELLLEVCLKGCKNKRNSEKFRQDSCNLRAFPLNGVQKNREKSFPMGRDFMRNLRINAADHFLFDLLLKIFRLLLRQIITRHFDLDGVFP